MPSNDRGVWEEIFSGSGQQDLVFNYLTYALYSFEKYEWYESFERASGQPPTPKEIDIWISQITEGRIRAWRESAARTFDASSKEYMKDYLTQETQKLVDDRVIASVQSGLDNFSRSLNVSLAELRKAGSFRNQFLIGFTMAILSPIILGVVILAIQAADLWPTAAQMFAPRHSETSGAGHNP